MQPLPAPRDRAENRRSPFSELKEDPDPMGTPGAGRKRTPRKTDFLQRCSSETQGWQQNWLPRAEARGIGMRELERQQQELGEKSDNSMLENYTRPSPSSRHSKWKRTRGGSGDTGSLIDPGTSWRELRESLSEAEEEYKRAMVPNAQLDNEKSNLIYQVDTLKDAIEEQEEQMADFYRENEEKSKELERQKHMGSVLQHKVDELN
ncbi:hypothetical protein QTO34_014303 [Cnephaeus nilssonii]|uniref:Leucine-rich repeat flightless-interacting protein 2 n=1 Tax=Cnephaeus nilssonii TaxID=3371016 RepID=A0AA40I644_CNENI|nr:hypothetical protein QTO34_014303 [Eptesicus nilssonii]